MSDMMVFAEQIDFINRDPRIDRDSQVTYPTTVETQTIRNSVFLPPDLLKDKKILDIGCCVAASGGWALSQGAARYVGVEISQHLSIIARENLEKYHAGKDFRIICSSAEDFLSENLESFDIVLATGVIFHISNQIAFLETLSRIADSIVIDSHNPRLADDFVGNLILDLNGLDITPETKMKLMKKYKYIFNMLLEEYPFTEFRKIDGGSDYGDIWKNSYDYKDDGLTVNNTSLICPSLGALRKMMNELGFDADLSPNQQLKEQMPKYYNNRRRYAVRFNKTDRSANPIAFKDILAA